MSRVTVLLTVCNGAAFLRPSIDSILAQTCRDLRLLVVDNASRDGSRDIVRAVADPRVQLLELPRNIGQMAALNAGLERIDSPLVARMDADDISLPQRLQRQADFLDAHPGVGVCGCWAEVFPGRRRTWRYPTAPADVAVELLFECCLAHPGVMLRKELFDRHRLRYDEALGHSEDWELWQRASRHFDLANLPEVLLRYRVHPASVSAQTGDRQRQAAERIDDAALGELGLANHPLRRVHRDVAFETLRIRNREPGFAEDVAAWFAELRRANRAVQRYDEQALDRFLRRRLFVVLTRNAGLGRRALEIHRREKLAGAVPRAWRARFAAKALWGEARRRLSRP